MRSRPAPTARKAARAQPSLICRCIRPTRWCAARLRCSARARAARRPRLTKGRHVLERIAATWTSLPDYAHSTALILLITVSLIICVALLTLWERKVIGWLHVRRGLGQPCADVFKLLMKEVIIPAKANKVLFRLAPMIALIPAFAAWAVI